MWAKASIFRIAPFSPPRRARARVVGDGRVLTLDEPAGALPWCGARLTPSPAKDARAWASRPGFADQYSCLMTKYDPRIVPASFDLSRANLTRDASSAGMSIPSESLKPTARFSGPSAVYITFTDSPFS